MQKSYTVVALSSIGILGIMGAAYAVTLSGDVRIEPDGSTPGNLTIEGGQVMVGIQDTTRGRIRLSGLTGYPQWYMQNEQGELLLVTNSGSLRRVRIQNDRSGIDADLHLSSGDIKLENGDLDVDSGNVNISNGDVVVAGGVNFDGSGTTQNASITATVDGDVVIQLGN